MTSTIDTVQDYTHVNHSFPRTVSHKHKLYMNHPPYIFVGLVVSCQCLDDASTLFGGGGGGEKGRKNKKCADLIHAFSHHVSRMPHKGLRLIGTYSSAV